MRTVRRIAVAALSGVTTVALVGFLGGAGPNTPASASTPQWHTAASYTPLANVQAVSCAPSSSAASATCVAVGDDGANFASIIVTSNGGSTWSDSTVPSGVTLLSTVSCPSAAICYAGGGSGILKSTDGGSTWNVQDQDIHVPSRSHAGRIHECTAVKEHNHRQDDGRNYLGVAGDTNGPKYSFQCLMHRLDQLRRSRPTGLLSRHIRNTGWNSLVDAQ